ncbi:MAG: sulfotransferase [Planctomycetota bacterium]
MAERTSIDRGVLGCIVAGFEKGGTTLVKDLLRNTGRMQSAFEGGLLLAARPAEGIPEPYATQLVESWKLPADFLDRYRSCGSFDAGYRLLRDLSCRCHKSRPLVDKTPRYMACLADVLRRAPGTPLVVVLRDPLQVTGSWLRLGKTAANAAATIRASILGMVSTPVELLSDVYVIQLADVVTDPAGACDRLQGWLGVDSVPYDATSHLGTGAAGELPPLGVQPERIAIEGRWSNAEIAQLKAEVTGLLPWADLVSQVPSGPLLDVLDDARPLWTAVAAMERKPSTLPWRPTLSLIRRRMTRRQATCAAGRTAPVVRLARVGEDDGPPGDHAAIPRDVLGCIVTGYVRAGATLLKNLLVETTPCGAGLETGLLLAERPADGIPEPHAGNFLERWTVDADFARRYRACPDFEAAYRLVRDVVSAPEHREAPLVDKTLQYLRHLEHVMQRAPGTPVVVAVRDPLELLVSWLHLGNSLGEALTSIRVATESLRAVVAEPRLAASVYMVSYTELRQDPGGTLASLQAWLGRWPLGLDLARTSGVPATAGGLHRMPQDIEADGCDLLGRVPALELERLRRELVREVPAAADLAAIRSGPARKRAGRPARAA